ncbi:LytTR family two component transcriptional regulator [Pontibacter mucosus]|uniref:LytTR family two component transcriptional regulator n=1 Tax=Pontibacter mucosus TaxID=1649266 RepID=A0A2T5YG21_9BACT|nr:LytTR family DNA-binding domain-containing protein [Pontibacter mucosus]PTX18260.1 LytTR family two component transcriptional regulator [Pontibacter mucosus]
MSLQKTYRCMVIDDENHAIEVLSDYIADTPRLQLVKTFQDPVAALMDEEEQYDFVFLDIDMPRLSGLDLARSLRDKTRFLVFTTAHQKYALEAFDVQADHFLLKPISLKKFALTVDLLLKNIERSAASAPPAEQTFFIKSDQKHKLIKINLQELVCVEGLKNYVLLHTLGQRHIAYLTMKEVEDALYTFGGFMRVHKSYIVAKSHIERVESRSIWLRNNLEVPIGDTYRQGFQEYLSDKILVTGR